MVDQVILYISAAPDLKAERSVITRSVTEIPVTLGWRIIETPLHGEMINDRMLVGADIHMLLLGIDIRAPVGLEWFLARRAGKNPLLFLKQGISRTLAADNFIHHLESKAGWHHFKDNADLRFQVLSLLGEQLTRLAGHYALKPQELDALNQWHQELKKESVSSVDERREVTEGGVIISPERYIPSEGVLIKKKKKKDEGQNLQ